MRSALATAIVLAAIIVPLAAWADSASYTYDTYGNLVSVTYANGTSITYTYDNATNRTQQAVSCSGDGC